MLVIRKNVRRLNRFDWLKYTKAIPNARMKPKMAPTTMVISLEGRAVRNITVSTPSRRTATNTMKKIPNVAVIVAAVFCSNSSLSVGPFHSIHTIIDTNKPAAISVVTPSKIWALGPENPPARN